jgi:hypothetical protein
MRPPMAMVKIVTSSPWKVLALVGLNHATRNAEKEVLTLYFSKNEKVLTLLWDYCGICFADDIT